MKVGKLRNGYFCLFICFVGQTSISCTFKKEGTRLRLLGEEVGILIQYKMYSVQCIASCRNEGSGRQTQRTH